MLLGVCDDAVGAAGEPLPASSRASLTQLCTTETGNPRSLATASPWSLPVTMHVCASEASESRATTKNDKPSP